MMPKYRRARQDTPLTGEVVRFFSDGPREVQESTCTGVALRQFVHGCVLDELILVDQAFPAPVERVISQCFRVEVPLGQPWVTAWFAQGSVQVTHVRWPLRGAWRL